MLGERSILQGRRSILRGGLKLWSDKDIIHLSTNYGLSKLILCIIEGLEKADDFYEYARQKDTETEERYPKQQKGAQH